MVSPASTACACCFVVHLLTHVTCRRRLVWGAQAVRGPLQRQECRTGCRAAMSLGAQILPPEGLLRSQPHMLHCSAGHCSLTCELAQGIIHRDIKPENILLTKHKQMCHQPKPQTAAKSVQLKTKSAQLRANNHLLLKTRTMLKGSNLVPKPTLMMTRVTYKMCKTV